MATDQDTLKLYDTLAREASNLVPIDGDTIRFYGCGPTVYGPAHVGNFRAFVVQDVLRRVIELAGWKTLHVRNITDVDDKTIRDSQEADLSLKEFTDGWRDQFWMDGKKLGLLRPHVEPSAVEHIPEQIEMIRDLIEKEHAYQGEDGSVYFRIASYPEYGRLSHLDQREIRAGAGGRAQDSDEYEKEGVSDFVLWKARKEADGNNFWNSPWGEGRPGWHLECSAMSHKYLGEEFDLHAGGVDLVFPHHENEIAQSCCSSGKGFARHWFHNAHLMVEGGKMAKSKGNLYTVDQIEEMGHDPMALRYVLVSGLYRQQLNFRLQSLEDAAQAMNRLAKFEGAVREVAGLEADFAYSYEQIVAGCGPGPFGEAWSALLDDLNTPAALGHLFSVLKSIKLADLTMETAREAWEGFHFILAALGLELPAGVTIVEAPPEIQALAEKRQEVRAAKDWAASDALRDEIAKAGWTLKDGADGFELAPK